MCVLAWPNTTPARGSARRTAKTGGRGPAAPLPSRLGPTRCAPAKEARRAGARCVRSSGGHTTRRSMRARAPRVRRRQRLPNAARPARGAWQPAAHGRGPWPHAGTWCGGSQQAMPHEEVARGRGSEPRRSQPAPCTSAMTKRRRARLRRLRRLGTEEKRESEVI